MFYRRTVLTTEDANNSYGVPVGLTYAERMDPRGVVTSVGKAETRHREIVTPELVAASRAYLHAIGNDDPEGKLITALNKTGGSLAEALAVQLEAADRGFQELAGGKAAPGDEAGAGVAHAVNLFSILKRAVGILPEGDPAHALIDRIDEVARNSGVYAASRAVTAATRNGYAK